MATKTIYQFAEGEDPVLLSTEEVEVDEPEAEPITIAPADLAALQTDLAKAKTVDGLKGVLSSFFDALA